MAFVYKDARRFSQKPPTKRKVGPGTYFGHSEYTIKKSIVPFQSSSFREGLKGGDQPGPGTYNVSNEYLKDKLIATNLNMDIKIVEVPKPNYVFKSGAKRFEDVHLKKKMENEPGPGHYHSSHDISKISFKYIKQNNPERMLFDELKKEKKIGQVPSIPTAQRLLGYSENEGILHNFKICCK